VGIDFYPFVVVFSDLGMYFKDFFLYISSVLLNWNDLKSLKSQHKLVSNRKHVRNLSLRRFLTKVKFRYTSIYPSHQTNKVLFQCLLLNLKLKELKENVLNDLSMISFTSSPVSYPFYSICWFP